MQRDRLESNIERKVKHKMVQKWNMKKKGGQKDRKQQAQLLIFLLHSFHLSVTLSSLSLVDKTMTFAYKEPTQILYTTSSSSFITIYSKSYSLFSIFFPSSLTSYVVQKCRQIVSLSHICCGIEPLHSNPSNMNYTSLISCTFTFTNLPYKMSRFCLFVFENLQNGSFFVWIS